MNYKKPLGQRDEASQQDYDVAFVGVNERLPAMQLSPGYVASAKNMRFRFGKAETRLGVQICPWMLGDGRTPWSVVYGGIVFGDPNGVEWFLIAADGGVWKTRPGTTATRVALPAGIVLTPDTFTMFVQCFEKIILLRGPKEAPLVCPSLDAGFMTVINTLTADDIAAGLTTMPNASYGLSYLDRLILIEGKDLMAVSNTLDYTKYIPVVDTFRINQGEADSLVAILPFGLQQLVPLKSQSIFQIDGAVGDFTGAVQSELTKQYGCVAPRSTVVYGSNAYWMSGEGIASLQLTQLNQTQTTEQMLDDPMQVTKGRINGAYRSGCVSEILNGFGYFAVPLDDAVQAGKDLIPAGATYYHSQTHGNFYLITGLTIGRKYRLTLNGDLNFGQLNCGAGVYGVYGSDVDFTATSTNASLYGVIHAAITAQVLPLWAGVNNGVMVYDFLQQAWAGVDEGPAFSTVAFLKATYRGRKRLFLLGADGILRLYEEGFEDEVLAPVKTPYIDLIMNGNITPGVGLVMPRYAIDTVQVLDGGTLITAQNLAANVGTSWGADTFQDAWANLSGGYLSALWTAGPAAASAINYGVRFSGGILAGIGVTGNWYFEDQHLGIEVTSVGIVSGVTTRGYVTRQYIFANEDKKRFLALVPMLATWAPTYSLTAIPNGQGAAEPYVTNQTKDNTQFDQQGAAAWDPTNANDNAGVSKRLDYAMSLPDAGFSLGANGVAFDLMQNSTDRVPVNEFGHWVQLQVANTTGRLELFAVFMEAQEGEKLSGMVI